MAHVSDMADLPVAELAVLCEKHGVRELSVFGSAVRGESGPDSDLDFLVEFRDGVRVGFLALQRMARELSRLCGRPVDLVSKGGLRGRLRAAVLAEAEVVYAA